MQSPGSPLLQGSGALLKRPCALCGNQSVTEHLQGPA